GLGSELDEKSAEARLMGLGRKRADNRQRNRQPNSKTLAVISSACRSLAPNASASGMTARGCRRALTGSAGAQISFPASPHPSELTVSPSCANNFLATPWRRNYAGSVIHALMEITFKCEHCQQELSV